MEMRKYYLSLFFLLLLISHVRMNDVTVPFVTSLIELEDPFLEKETNGLEV
jgi:uncharacterized protein YggT (Ycf19 family)